MSSLCCGELLVSEPVIYLSPHHTTRFFCCAAALGVRVHRCGNIGTFKNSNYLDTNQPNLTHLRPPRQFFNAFFAKIADDRQQQTTCGEQNVTTVYRGRTMCACRILSLRWRVAFVIACHVLSSCSLVLNTCYLHNIPRVCSVRYRYRRYRY